MFTLLPQQQRKLLYRQYRTRLLIVILLMSTSLAIICAIMLLPSYIYLSFSHASLEGQMSQVEKKVKEKSNKGIMTVLGGIQSNLSIIKPDETEIVDTIKKVINDMNTGISITSFTYNYGSKNNSSLTFKGVAKTRSELIDFTKELKKEIGFTGVDLPISNLAKEVDVPFNITVVGKF
jgi:hypothetical protein